MEEVPIVPAKENPFHPFHMEIIQTMLPLLMENMQMTYDTVTIKSENGKTFGSLLEPYCLIFNYYTNLKFGNFKEAATGTKIMTLPSQYTDEECEFFVEIIPKLFTSTIKLSGRQLVWLFKFFDTFVINDQIGETLLKNIPIYSDNKSYIVDQLIIECAGKNPGPYMMKLYEKVIPGLSLAIGEWTPSLLTFSVGRNIIIKSLKSDDYKCSDETKLFEDILIKIKELTKTSSYKISFKAFLDIMACIRWFYVDESKVLELVPTIKELYPEFEITNAMTSCFTRRKQLVHNYDKARGTFKYGDILGKLDARSNYYYSQELDLNIKSIYTFYSTTEKSFPIELRITIFNKKRSDQKFIVISSQIQGLLIYFDLKEIGAKKEKIISQRWTFTKPLFIPIDDSNKTKYTLTLRMAYIPSTKFI